MKFTALEEYGLRCILRLAQKEVQDLERTPCGTDQGLGCAFLTIGEVAGGEGLTEQYAGKIFRILQKARLVESVRGCKGGYRLARPPQSITVGETLDALGGRLFDGDVCGRYTGDRHVCVRTTDCAIRSLWRELQSMMDRVLLRTTLSDLIASEHVMSLRVQEYAGDRTTPTAPGVSSPSFVAMGSLLKDNIQSEER